MPEHHLLVHVFVEIVVGGIGYHGAEANGQREKHLGNSCIPNERIKQLPPLWLEEVHNAIPSAGQRHSAQQQQQQHHIRKHAQEVGGLATALNAAYQHAAYDDPSHSQTGHQLPIGQTQTLVNIGQLMENLTPVLG